MQNGARPEAQADPVGASPPLIRETIVAAATALHLGDARSHDTLIERLAEIPADSPDGRVLDAEIASCLASAVTLAWRREWQPVDLVRVAERQLAKVQCRLLLDAIVAHRHEHRAEDFESSSQTMLDELHAEVWWDRQQPYLSQWAARETLARRPAVANAVGLLAFLWHLPTFPKLEPRPKDAHRHARAVDTRVLGRVRALLAKAESTTFPDEAEALSAKAQELMARHMIDRVMLDQGGKVSASECPTGVHVRIDDPYAGAKSMLLGGVAQANRCRSVWSPDLGLSTVFGHEIDLETVELLFSSLLVQATRAMVAAGSQVDGAGRSRTRSFRQSFLVAYGVRIGARLKEANDSIVDEAADGTNLLPVLASREAAVEAAIWKAFPNMKSHSLSATNSTGWAAGTMAADLASLSTRSEVPAGV